MNVLVINWRDIKNPEAGGAEIHIDEILKRKPDNWDIDFVSASFPGSKSFEDLKYCRVHRIPNNFLFNFTFYFYWLSRFKKNKYDLIIDDISKIPLAVNRYIKNIPILAIHHHIHGKSLFNELPYPLAFYVYKMEKFFLKYYINLPIVVVSESNKNELLELYPFKNLILLYNGVDNNLYKNNNNYKMRKKQILYFGRLKKYKRIDHIIYALNILRKKNYDLKFIIAGKGEDELRLRKIVSEYKLSDFVEFKGFVSEEEKAKLISESLVYVITSTKEGWGITVIEASSGGLPVVSYDVEGINCSVVNNTTGFLVENGNIEKLSEKIELLINNEELWEQFSKNGIKWAENFSWDKTASDFYQIANNIIEDWKKRGEY